jgi:hypothetical protein
VAIKGTPLEGQEPPTGLDLVRCIATARIVMPKTVVRLSAGRLNLSFADQALAFLAGANSIFDGDKLLTTANNDRWGRAPGGLCRGGGAGVVGGLAGGNGGRAAGWRVAGGGGRVGLPAAAPARLWPPPPHPPAPCCAPPRPAPRRAARRRNEDESMFEMLGLRSRPAFLPYGAGGDSSSSFAAPAAGAGAGAAQAAEGGCCGSKAQAKAAGGCC